MSQATLEAEKEYLELILTSRPSYCQPDDECDYCGGSCFHVWEAEPGKVICEVCIHKRIEVLDKLISVDTNSCNVTKNPRNSDGEFQNPGLLCYVCGKLNSHYHILTGKLICKGCLTKWIEELDEAILENTD